MSSPGCLMALNLSEQPQPCPGTQLFPTGYISSSQWRLCGVHSRQPGISCLRACSHQPCGQPGTTEYGCAVHSLCYGDGPVHPHHNTSRFRGSYVIFFKKYFLHFPHWTCIPHLTADGGNLHMGKTTHPTLRNSLMWRRRFPLRSLPRVTVQEAICAPPNS